MQTPSNMDNHQAWGGQRFQNILGGDSSNMTQQTYVGHERPESRFRPSSQVGILASHSDDLFYPTVTQGGPSSQPYTLPNVPAQSSSHSQVHNQQMNTFPSRHMHHPSSLSSYNNPAFAIPPLSPQPLPFYNPLSQAHVFPVLNPSTVPLGLRQPQASPPHIYTQLPHNRPQSVHSVHNHQSNCNHHCNSHFSSHLPTTTLPTVTHIPLLTFKSDFPAWDDGVTAIIHANGLTGHILDASEPVDLFRPDHAPNPLPILPPLPSPLDLKNLNYWWNEDNIVQHILISRLGTIPRGLLLSSHCIVHLQDVT